MTSSCDPESFFNSEFRGNAMEFLFDIEVSVLDSVGDVITCDGEKGHESEEKCWLRESSGNQCCCHDRCEQMNGAEHKVARHVDAFHIRVENDEESGKKAEREADLIDESADKDESKKAAPGDHSCLVQAGASGGDGASFSAFIFGINIGIDELIEGHS